MKAFGNVECSKQQIFALRDLLKSKHILCSGSQILCHSLSVIKTGIATCITAYLQRNIWVSSI